MTLPTAVRVAIRARAWLIVSSILLSGGSGAVSADPAPPAYSSPIVADGFEVERVAASPLIRHPIMAAFDDRGRLYVAETTGENLDAAQLTAKNPGRIRRLEDRDGDGRFDFASDFATGLTMPMGAQWHDGALYVAAPPDILRLEDADGDGFAERRRAIVTGFVYNGNGADNHGPVLGPDGWLYFTDGRHGYHLPTREGPVLHGLASQVFRCRPDGRELQRVCGGGFDNPVEVAFNRAGEMFGTLTFYTDPRDGLRDALVHWVEGGVYPKVHDCLKEFRRSGPLLPALRLWPAVAPSGLMLVRGRALGADVSGNLVSTQFNTGRVQRHPIRREGATYDATDLDLLYSADPDFHPTDVLEDADGSLLVIDTGGWFRRGCPRSVIAKPDILGAIYRIRRRGATRIADPWGLRIDWASGSLGRLIELLGDGRFAVRDKAIAALEQCGEAAVAPLAGALKSTGDPETRVNALWALARIGTPSTRPAIREGLDDPEADVRIAACHAIGLSGDREAWGQLARMVAHDEPPVRRQAATALGQLGDARSPIARALLDGLRSATNPDPFLEHAMIQALIQVNDPSATRPGLSDPNVAVRRGALIAMDQMADGSLAAEEVLPLLDCDEPALRSAALEVLQHHTAWAKQILGVLSAWLGRAERDPSADAALRRILSAFETEREVQEWVARSLEDRPESSHQRLLLVEVIGRSRLNRLPAPWEDALGMSLDGRGREECRVALAAIRARRMIRFDGRLASIARDADLPDDLRLAALGALGGRLSALTPDLLEFLIACIVPDKLPLVRLSAAEILSVVPLDEDQSIILAGRLTEADPLVLPPLLRSFGRSASVPVGRALLAALGRRKDGAISSATELAATLKAFPPEVAADAKSLLDRLGSGRGDEGARLEALAPLLIGGDPERGRAVFFGNKASCFGCHRIGSEGGTIGPDLTKIGAVRSGRDLLEAFVYPSASFAQGFEPVAVATTDGRVLGGVIARRDGAAVVLRTADRSEVRLRPEEIEEIRPSPTSIMPQGLDTTLSSDEIRDLLSYLQRRN